MLEGPLLKEKRIYLNAPIESAIIDVQVAFTALSDMALLAAPPQEIRDRYPESKPVVSGTAAPFCPWWH